MKKSTDNKEVEALKLKNKKLAERVKELKRENRSLSGKLATSKAKNDKLRNGVKKK